jgi:hypothetical protein
MSQASYREHLFVANLKVISDRRGASPQTTVLLLLKSQKKTKRRRRMSISCGLGINLGSLKPSRNKANNKAALSGSKLCVLTSMFSVE